MNSDTTLERADANTIAGAILPVPAPPVSIESRVLAITKFLSWLTACLLATAVIISLISIASERDNLREQLKNQSIELACRSAAAVDVNIAVGLRDNLIAEALVYVAESDMKSLISLIVPLQQSTDDVNLALTGQEESLKNCNRH